jgi:hypothetical protein
MTKLEDLNVSELKALAKEYNVKGIAKLDKQGLIDKISEAKGIKKKVEPETETVEEDTKKISLDGDIDLQNKIEELLKAEEAGEDITVEEEVTVDESLETAIQNIPEEEHDVDKIDFSKEESINTNSSDFVKQISNELKTTKKEVKTVKTDDDLDLNIEYENEALTDDDLDKEEYKIVKAYQASMIISFVFKKLDPQRIYTAEAKYNISSDKIKSLLSKELQDSEPFEEDKKETLVNFFVENFESEIERCTTLANETPIELSLQHKKWLEYLNIYKQTPSDILQRYPNHPHKQVFEDLHKYLNTKKG